MGKYFFFSKWALLLIALLSVVSAVTISAHFWNTSLPTIQKIQLGMVAIPGKSYEIGKYEVTAAEWNAVMGSASSYVASYLRGEDKPVVEVSWNEFQVYLKRLNKITGKNYRLPTNEEWEYACYGGVQTKYCGGDDVDSVAWFGGNSSKHVHPVGQKRANGYGLNDMSGNVSEWLESCGYGGSYDEKDCSWRMQRGGSFLNGNDSQESAFWISAKRVSGNEVDSKFDSLGFRLARTLP